MVFSEWVWGGGLECDFGGVFGVFLGGFEVFLSVGVVDGLFSCFLCFFSMIFFNFLRRHWRRFLPLFFAARRQKLDVFILCFLLRIRRRFFDVFYGCFDFLDFLQFLTICHGEKAA